MISTNSNRLQLPGHTGDLHIIKIRSPFRALIIKLRHRDTRNPPQPPRRPLIIPGLTIGVTVFQSSSAQTIKFSVFGLPALIAFATGQNIARIKHNAHDCRSPQPGCTQPNLRHHHIAGQPRPPLRPISTKPHSFCPLDKYRLVPSGKINCNDIKGPLISQIGTTSIFPQLAHADRDSRS